MKKIALIGMLGIVGFLASSVSLHAVGSAPPRTENVYKAPETFFVATQPSVEVFYVKNHIPVVPAPVFTYVEQGNRISSTEKIAAEAMRKRTIKRWKDFYRRQSGKLERNEVVEVAQANI